MSDIKICNVRVFRRIGGLEITDILQHSLQCVFRRIGGLEMRQP